MTRFLACLAAVLIMAAGGSAEELSPLRPSVADLAYVSGDGATDYRRERCRLDLYLAPDAGDEAGRPVVVFFHGGGLQGGDKQSVEPFARLLTSRGAMVVAANYRLSPRVAFPAYVQDAADAVRWTHEHIAEHGGDPERLFLSGHSAGGYLTLMAAAELGCFTGEGEPEITLAGLLPISGQTLTHTAVRGERGLPSERVVADEAAPLNVIHAAGPPTLLLCGDRDLPLRLEQNELLLAHLKRLGDRRSSLFVGSGRDHGTIYDQCDQPGDPVGAAMIEFLGRHTR